MQIFLHRQPKVLQTFLTAKSSAKASTLDFADWALAFYRSVVARQGLPLTRSVAALQAANYLVIL